MLLRGSPEIPLELAFLSTWAPCCVVVREYIKGKKLVTAQQLIWWICQSVTLKRVTIYSGVEESTLILESLEEATPLNIR